MAWAPANSPAHTCVCSPPVGIPAVLIEVLPVVADEVLPFSESSVPMAEPSGETGYLQN